MEPIFTLPYSEYEVINQMKKFLKNKEYTFYTPVSRQQKGVDFLIHSTTSPKKILRFQVKSSKVYIHKTPKNINNKGYSYHLWLNNFLSKDRYTKGDSDWYIFFGLYPIVSAKSTKKLKGVHNWKPIILGFNENSIFLKIHKKSKFIDIYFNIHKNSGDVTDVLGTRGFKKKIFLTKYLLKNKIGDLIKRL